MAYLIEIFVALFCICIAVFLIYLGYVWFLKKFRGYRFKDGVPDVAIMRQSQVGCAGNNRFGSAPFRASHLGLELERPQLLQNSLKRPHTFPLDSSSKVSVIPEIRVDIA